MKKTLLLSVLFLSCVSCSCQKKEAASGNAKKTEEKITQLSALMEYEAYSRGSYIKASLQNQMLSVVKKRDEIPVINKISDADWKEILAVYKNLNLKAIANLKAPSEKRFYDGAPIAHFKVIEDGITYQSTDFDGGYPPAEIDNIVNKIITLAANK